jgi:hypothetical protein
MSTEAALPDCFFSLMLSSIVGCPRKRASFFVERVPMRIVGMPVVLIAGAALSGYWMWRRATATMYYRSANPTIRPSHVTPEEYDAQVIRRRKRVRLLKSAFAAAAGGLLAALLFVLVDGGLSRH